jgi:beta-glucanase (GH16 family)
MYFFKKLVLLVLICGASGAAAQTWNLVWEDSFNNNSITSSNWIFEQGNNNGWGNNELQCYTNRPDNAVVSNGALHIIAKQEPYQGCNYTSARIISKGLQTWTYGKVEARIKLPQTQGLWPALWMLGNNIDQVSWPVCAEIDIMEHVNYDSKIHGTMHWDNNGHVQYGGSTNCNVSQYHTYSIEWGPDSINWKLDNVFYHTANIKNNINNTGAFHKPFFLLLNMAVGGNWPGVPSAASVFPDTMLVDYVRVFQKGYPLANTFAANQRDKQFDILSINNSHLLLYTFKGKTPAVVRVSDLSGKVLLSHNIERDDYSGQIDCSSLPPSIYIYQCVSTDGTSCFGKFVISQ